MPAILWTNTMTEKGVEKFLPKDDYIIQVSFLDQQSQNHWNLRILCFRSGLLEKIKPSRMSLTRDTKPYFPIMMLGTLIVDMLVGLELAITGVLLIKVTKFLTSYFS